MSNKAKKAIAILLISAGLIYLLSNYIEIGTPLALAYAICALMSIRSIWVVFAEMRPHYEVQIEPSKSLIRALDLQLNQELWVDDFQPEHLYIFEVQVIGLGQAQEFPMLAYGIDHREFSEVGGTPNVQRCLLGFGETASLKKVLEELQFLNLSSQAKN